MTPNLPYAKDATFDDALCGGEDYKLLLTVDKDEADNLSLRFETEFGYPLYKIGRVEKSEYDIYDVGLENDSGDVAYSSAGWGGYTHF